MCSSKREFIPMESLAYTVIEINTLPFHWEDFCYSHTQRTRELTKRNSNECSNIQILENLGER